MAMRTWQCVDLKQESYNFLTKSLTFGAFPLIMLVKQSYVASSRHDAGQGLADPLLARVGEPRPSQ